MELLIAIISSVSEYVLSRFFQGLFFDQFWIINS